MSKLAIKGGQPVRTAPFPTWPDYTEEVIDRVVRVVQSRKWWRQDGNEVRAFESAFAKSTRATRALAVTNGTHALELALATLGIGAGDEVILPALTFISTVSAVLYANAIPIPVDVDANTFCLDPEAVEAAITPRTRAIIVVHLAGQSADMDRLCEIAMRFGIAIIEDAAHAHGAEWRGRRLGSIGDIGTFSFQAAKLMSAGEGGALTFQDETHYERAFLINNCGRVAFDRDYQHQVLGTNYRMSEFQAAVLLPQLDSLDIQNSLREANAAELDSRLAKLPVVRLQRRDQRVTLHPHYMYVLVLDLDYLGISQHQIVAALNAEGIPAFRLYSLVHHTPMFQNHQFGAMTRWPGNPLYGIDYTHQFLCPRAQNISNCGIWLPHRLLLGGHSEVEDIAEAIAKVIHYVEDLREPV